MSLLTVSGYFFRPRSLRPDGPRPAPAYAENISGSRDLVTGGMQGRGMVVMVWFLSRLMKNDFLDIINDTIQRQ